jgi:hypothetical protein
MKDIYKSHKYNIFSEININNVKLHKNSKNNIINNSIEINKTNNQLRRSNSSNNCNILNNRTFLFMNKHHTILSNDNFFKLAYFILNKIKFK